MHVHIYLDSALVAVFTIILRIVITVRTKDIIYVLISHCDGTCACLSNKLAVFERKALPDSDVRAVRIIAFTIFFEHIHGDAQIVNGGLQHHGS